MNRLQIVMCYLIAYVVPILITAVIFGILENRALRKQAKRKDTI